MCFVWLFVVSGLRRCDIETSHRKLNAANNKYRNTISNRKERENSFMRSFHFGLSRFQVEQNWTWGFEVLRGADIQYPSTTIFGHTFLIFILLNLIATCRRTFFISSHFVSRTFGNRTNFVGLFYSKMNGFLRDIVFMTISWTNTVRSINSDRKD